MLYVGSVFSRRHVPELVAGFTRLAQRHTDVRLEVVGDNRSIPPVDLMAITAATGLGDRIRVRPYVSDGELATLYAQATAFAFLSDYEGFGLTPLEALALDIPIVVLDTAVAREVYGDDAAELHVVRLLEQQVGLYLRPPHGLSGADEKAA